MAAVLTMGGPSTKAQRQQEAAQERAAKSRQWGRCERHDNDLVAVKGYCPECGEVVGERVMRVEEFDALNPLNHEIRETGPEPPSTVVVRTKGHEVRETDALPRNLLAYAASRAQDPPKRCPAPGCGALELRPLPDGSWRCLKSGHDPRAYELVPLAVRGGSE